MIERRKQKENTHTNLAFSHTFVKPAWKELQRTSIEISNETLVPGDYGIKVVRGRLIPGCLGKNKEPCSVKMLKGTVLFDESVLFLNKLLCIVQFMKGNKILTWPKSTQNRMLTWN